MGEDCCRSEYSCLHCGRKSYIMAECLSSASSSSMPCCLYFMTCGSLKPSSRILQVTAARGRLITHFKPPDSILVGSPAATGMVMKSCRQRRWHRSSHHHHSTVPAADRLCLQGWRQLRTLQIHPRRGERPEWQWETGTQGNCCAG